MSRVLVCMIPPADEEERREAHELFVEGGAWVWPDDPFRVQSALCELRSGTGEFRIAASDWTRVARARDAQVRGLVTWGDSQQLASHSRREQSGEEYWRVSRPRSGVWTWRARRAPFWVSADEKWSAPPAWVSLRGRVWNLERFDGARRGSGTSFRLEEPGENWEPNACINPWLLRVDLRAEWTAEHAESRSRGEHRGGSSWGYPIAANTDALGECIGVLERAESDDRLLFVMPERLPDIDTVGVRFLDEISRHRVGAETVAQRVYLGGGGEDERRRLSRLECPAWLPRLALGQVLTLQPDSWLGVEGFGTGRTEFVVPSLAAGSGPVVRWLFEFWSRLGGAREVDALRWHGATEAPSRPTWLPGTRHTDADVCNALCGDPACDLRDAPDPRSRIAVKLACSALQDTGSGGPMDLTAIGDSEPVDHGLSAEDALHLFGRRHLCGRGMRPEVPVRVQFQWASDTAPEAPKAAWYALLGIHSEMGWRSLINSLVGSTEAGHRPAKTTIRSHDWLHDWYRALAGGPADQAVAWADPTARPRVGSPRVGDGTRVGASNEPSFKLEQFIH